MLPYAAQSARKSAPESLAVKGAISRKSTASRDEAASRAADLFGAERGWSEERRRQELATLQEFYVAGVLD
jgi:hypothetical protein